MKFAAYLLAGIAVGAGFAVWQLDGQSAGAIDGSLAFDDGAPIERRISELETALTLERYERQALADELEELRVAVADAGAAAPAEDIVDERRQRVAALIESGDGDNPLAQRVRERFGGPGPFDQSTADERQIQRFIDAGLSPERAQWIIEREDALQMEVLQARFEATQGGASAQEVANMTTSQLMREELGDTDYEKYLEGLGRPTSINVREVLTNSPAQTAGLQPGDEIVAYDGKRVFDMNELNGLTYEGSPGQSVAIDVLRDGQAMTLYVERGPIGVSGGGRAQTRRRR
jgi:hypothetical protein